MADEVKPEVVEASPKPEVVESSTKPEVVESSTTTTTSTTKVTRRIRRTSRSRSPSPSRGRSSRSRSPSRRKALNRSPSPHRYNTRINSQVSAEEQTETTPTSGCSLTSSLSCVSSAVSHIIRKYKSITVDLIKCSLYITLAYIALTMCSFGKCDIRYPTVPSLSVIYNEKIFLECLAGFVVCVLAFSVTLGQGTP
ncbi:uncharacterized protein LOC134818766 [Bolinopsis microptera]|uniref:uncharacterized protein LOC134818766 n=1 Tax=Bolinopsis microptera TaxID=2820187 RepID=UPI00307AFBB3